MRLEIPVGERAIVLETGKLARQAGGSITARLGDTMVLSTATRSEAPRPGATFLPLSVDIEERMSSAGKIPGGFIKREGRPYDTISMVGASAALSLSDIPYDGPIGAVRVGREPDGGFILNPTYQQLAES